MSKPETMMIDDVKYVRADSVDKLAPELDGMKYCVIRTYSAGVHIGYVEKFGSDNNPQYVKLLNSRRLHQWSNACSLSQVAMDGVSADSRIAMELPEIELTDVIEVIPCSEKSAEFFKGAKAWKK
jgi:hypothetical protein